MNRRRFLRISPAGALAAPLAAEAQQARRGADMVIDRTPSARHAPDLRRRRCYMAVAALLGSLRSIIVPVATVFCLVGVPRPVVAQLSPGTILVTDGDAGSELRGVLFQVDPTTGERVVLSDFNSPDQGPVGVQPFNVVVETTGTILVLDNEAAGTRGLLFRVDPSTGQRAVLSDFSNPNQGPLGIRPVGIALETTGAILVTDRSGIGPFGTLMRVNPVTGQRTVLSDFSDPNDGPLGAFPVGLAVEASGSIIVSDIRAGTGLGLLFRVDPSTGQRTVVSDFNDPNQGELGANATGVTAERSGTILISDGAARISGLLFRVDPTTGQRIVLSDFGNPDQGPLALFPVFVAAEAEGTILVTDVNGGTLFRVDPSTGDRTVLSDLSNPEQGFLGMQPFGVTVVATKLFTPVVVDIKPGSFLNIVNLKSNGVIPVAILTTENFDATTVDPISVRFGPSDATEAHGRGHVQDVNADGRPDLLLHFRTQDSGIECGNISASLTGQTFDGAAIQGVDVITTAGCNKERKKTSR